MKRSTPLLLNLALAGALGCANVAGISDLKKEGEGGKGLNASCAAISECGAGLTCVGGSCLRRCFNLASPAKECGVDACVPLLTLTEAVCFPGGENIGEPCTLLSECAPGHNCVEFTAGAGGRCAPYCHASGIECGGADVCHSFANPITIDGTPWGICGPPTG